MQRIDPLAVKQYHYVILTEGGTAVVICVVWQTTMIMWQDDVLLIDRSQNTADIIQPQVRGDVNARYEWQITFSNLQIAPEDGKRLVDAFNNRQFIPIRYISLSGSEGNAQVAVSVFGMNIPDTQTGLVIANGTLYGACPAPSSLLEDNPQIY